MEELEIRPISLTRFNALGGYARAPGAWLIMDELEHFEQRDWYSNDGSRQLDFGGLVLAKDQKQRFRCVAMADFHANPEEAKKDLFAKMRHAAVAQAEDHHQGDEQGKLVDFFTHLHEPAKLHPSFVQLTTLEGYSPAKEIIEPMMRWYEDADGNFVEQFQTTGFDQRIWELYLFATLIEAGYVLNRDHNAPDFCCQGLPGHLAIEAVTVGPTIKNGRSWRRLS